ncbi:MAG: hypothetical protein VR66_16555 [Peptococcaceae bacterium BRH_c23]|nr:MAG: hypothetical protein VR66_16555 [Peptococcaceae bacterium BRH_c23]KJS85183.1 MAG: hypothetical protein JL57_19225 [Desulfosporosinus sp. BICA1-9]HBW38298.1 ATP-binding protein [Desulfosporosinus sp.]
MENVTINGVLYRYCEQFDVNLTLQYENERWSEWHIIREFMSNALDAVGGQIDDFSLTEEDGFIHIHDHGNGYPINYAKRIGASSKKNEEQSIGQFGEGTKMAILTCLRKGISVRLASQNWLIIPTSMPVEDDLDVLFFDIYQSDQSIQGSLVSIEAIPEIKVILKNKGQYFLQFSPLSPLYGSMNQGIYPSQGKTKLYNKGVYIKDIDALYTYGISISQLNRDRDLIDEEKLSQRISDILNNADNPSVIQSYFEESSRIANGVSLSNYKELKYSLYPDLEVRQTWVNTFYSLFGSKAIISTSDLASREAECLGHTPIRLEYYGRTLADFIGIPKDIHVISDDYEFTWTDDLNDHEEKRLSLFNQVTELLDLQYPETVRVFDTYAKSENVVGLYNHDKDEIYLKRERLSGNLEEALGTFIHELNHKSTGADDTDRKFADGLSSLTTRLVLRLIKTVGIPTTLKLTDRGFKLPKSFSYQADKLMSHITAIGNQIMIQTNGHILSSKLSGLNLKAHCSERPVTFYKGNFYINIPNSIRQFLPEEVSFNVTINAEQI